MTAEQLRRLNLYMLAIAIGAVVSGGGVLQYQLSSTGVLEPAPILAAMLGTLITGLSTSVLPSLKASVDAIAKSPPVSPPIRTTDATYPVIHRECGKTAFLSLVPPAPFVDLQASTTLHLDGRPMVAQDPIVCDACLSKLTGVMANAGQWVAVSEPRGLGS